MSTHSSIQNIIFHTVTHFVLYSIYAKQNFQLNFISTSYPSPFHTIILGVNTKHIAHSRYLYGYYSSIFAIRINFNILHVDILYSSRPVVSFAIPPNGCRVYIGKIHKFISLCFVIEFLILYYCVGGGRLDTGNILYNKTSLTASEQQTIDRVELENM